MADLLFILMTVAFFAITVGFVQLCDKIIGPDSEHGDLSVSGDAEPEPTTAPDPELATTGSAR